VDEERDQGNERPNTGRRACSPMRGEGPGALSSTGAHSVEEDIADKTSAHEPRKPLRTVLASAMPPWIGALPLIILAILSVVLFNPLLSVEKPLLQIGPHFEFPQAGLCVSISVHCTLFSHCLVRSLRLCRQYCW
jgi:hypothetical protein